MPGVVHSTVHRVVHRRSRGFEDVLHTRRQRAHVGVAGQALAHRARQLHPGQPVVAHGLEVGLVGVVLRHLCLHQLEHAYEHVVLALLLARHDVLALRHQRLTVRRHHLAHRRHRLGALAHAVARGQLGAGDAGLRTGQLRLCSRQLCLALVEHRELQRQVRATQALPVGLFLPLVTNLAAAQPAPPLRQAQGIGKHAGFLARGQQLQVALAGQREQPLGIVLGGHGQGQVVAGFPRCLRAAQAEQGIERKPPAPGIGLGPECVNARLAGDGLFLSQLQFADVAGVEEPLRQFSRRRGALGHRSAHRRHLARRHVLIPAHLHVRGHVQHRRRHFPPRALVVGGRQPRAGRQQQQIQQRQRHAGGALVAPAVDGQARQRQARVIHLHGLKHLGAGQAKPRVLFLQARAAQHGHAQRRVQRHGLGEPLVDGGALVGWRAQGVPVQGVGASRLKQGRNVVTARLRRQAGAAGKDGGHGQRGQRGQRAGGGSRHGVFSGGIGPAKARARQGAGQEQESEAGKDARRDALSRWEVGAMSREGGRSAARQVTPVLRPQTRAPPRAARRTLHPACDAGNRTGSRRCRSNRRRRWTRRCCRRAASGCHGSRVAPRPRPSPGRPPSDTSARRRPRGPGQAGSEAGRRGRACVDCSRPGGPINNRQRSRL